MTQLLSVPADPEFGFFSFAQQVALSADGSTAVLYLLQMDDMEKATVWVYDLPSLRLRTSGILPTQSNATVAVSDDGKLLFLISTTKIECFNISHYLRPPLPRYQMNVEGFHRLFGNYLLTDKFLKDVAVYRFSQGSALLEGELALNGWQGPTPEHLRYTLRDAQTGQVAQEGQLSLQPAGLSTSPTFAIPAQPGDYVLTVKGAPFLAGRGRLGSLGRFAVRLMPGDIDGDNEVTLLDFGLLVRAFGTAVGEDDYDINADLDGDGEITLWDFAWLVMNFGEIGDE